MKALIDSTLREGAQCVGVAFPLAQKKEIFGHLCQVGIEEIELGVATPLDPDLPLLLAHGRAAQPWPRLALWCRCRPEDIRFAARLGPDVLSLSIPGSDIHIKSKLGKDRAWVLAQVKASVCLARELGIRAVSLGIEDATRGEPGFLLQIAGAALAHGINRLRLADTVGIATPGEIAGLIGLLHAHFPVELGVHCHNDFGMATANSIAALEAGAAWADVSVLGIGERAGLARLEEVAGFLAIRGSSQYQLNALAPLANTVAKTCGRKIEPHQPVIGERIFHCETGLHLQGLLKEPATYEPYPPELVGARRELLFGAKVGKRQIRDCLNNLGQHPSPLQLETMVCRLRESLSALGRPLGLQEFTALARRGFSSPQCACGTSRSSHP